MISKTIVGGKLSVLRPGQVKGEKGKQQQTIEMKISDLPLAEVVALLKGFDGAGVHVRKLQLTMGANQAGLDVYVVVAEGAQS